MQVADRGMSKRADIRHELAEVRRERRADELGYWLRWVGYVTRPTVYIGSLIAVVWLLWFALALTRHPADLEILDLLLIGGCVVGFFGAAIPLALSLFNVDGGDIKWETWGRLGLGLITATVVTSIWLIGS
jgi:hypothetical protein